MPVELSYLCNDPHGLIRGYLSAFYDTGSEFNQSIDKWMFKVLSQQEQQFALPLAT